MSGEVVKKKPWLSKTLWANAAFALAKLFGLDEKIGLSADQVLMVLVVVNMGLRLVTKDKVSLED